MGRRVRVSIDELVVEGVSRGEAEALRFGLAAALEREFAESQPGQAVEERSLQRVARPLGAARPTDAAAIASEVVRTVRRASS